MITPADLAGLYPRPDPMRSDEQADRFEHLDVPHLTDDDLRRELAALRVLNFFCDDRDSEWRRDRELRLANEAAARYRRRRGSR